MSRGHEPGRHAAPPPEQPDHAPDMDSPNDSTQTLAGADVDEPAASEQTVADEPAASEQTVADEPAASEQDDPAASEQAIAEKPAASEQTIGDRVRTAVRGLGQTCITLGVVILLFIVYELWFTDYINAGQQHDATNKLEKAWGSGDDPLIGTDPADKSKIRTIALGTGIAIIRIPRLGLDYARTIVEGTNAEDLDIGPGHYTNSALPGQVGNLAIAGHRVGKGSPFLDLDKLQPGDAIVIETKSAYFTYRVLGDPASDNFDKTSVAGVPGREIVDPSAVKVVAPVPDHIGATPTRAMITLTTCNPKFSAHQRMIIHGVLQGAAQPKSAGPPAALKTQP